MPGPAATVGSMHICPMCNPGTPPPPHVGGPVTGPGAPSVLIEGRPAARMGDMCMCQGPPDTIVQGEATVIIEGSPASAVGDGTGHGGKLTGGAPSVLIGTGVSAASTITPVKKIPFPKISTKLKLYSSISGKTKMLNNAIAEQDKIRKLAEDQEGTPRVYNPKWIYEKKKVGESYVLKNITLRADVMYIKEGASVTFKIKKSKAMQEAEQRSSSSSTDSSAKATSKEQNTEEDPLMELTGIVKDREVVVTWDVEDTSSSSSSS